MEHIVVIDGIRYIKNGRITEDNVVYEVLTPINDSELSDMIMKVVKKDGVETYERLDKTILENLDKRYGNEK